MAFQQSTIVACRKAEELKASGVPNEKALKVAGVSSKTFYEWRAAEGRSRKSKAMPKKNTRGRKVQATVATWNTGSNIGTANGFSSTLQGFFRSAQCLIDIGKYDAAASVLQAAAKDVESQGS